MDVLNFLAKKDKLWRQISFNISKDDYLKDELTNLMYLRIYDYQIPVEKLTENYIGFVIYNLFRDYCKRKKHISLDSLFNIAADEVKVNDFTDAELKILNQAENIEWWKKELLIHSYDKSLRQIEDEFNINYMFVYRHINIAKKQLLQL